MNTIKIPKNLPQTLQANQRGVAVHHKGIFKGYENIITLTAEDVASEVDRDAILAGVESMIDNISSLPEMKAFLQKLVRRLIKNGSLP